MDASPSKRIRTTQKPKYPKLGREYDQNAPNRKAYMTMLSGLPAEHIVHCTLIRQMIACHLMVPGVRRETRVVYKLYNACKPKNWQRTTKAIRDGATIYELGTAFHRRGTWTREKKTLPTPEDAGVLATEYDLDSSGVAYKTCPHITTIKFHKCGGLVPFTMDWRPLSRLARLSIACKPHIGLVRSLPESFCTSLTRLNYLSLAGGLYKIPAAIGEIKKLATLCLRNMDFSRNPLPDTMGDFRHLKTLCIEQCGMWGPIPQWIQRLVSLTRLELNDNTLTGALPPWMSKMTTLCVLDLSNNQLTGPLNLAALTKLTWVNLNGNHFELGLPPQLQPALKWP